MVAGAERRIRRAEDHHVGSLGDEMREGVSRTRVAPHREARAEALAEVVERERSVLEDARREGERDGRSGAHQLVGKRIAVRAKESHDVVAPEAKVAAVGPEMGDLPAIGPVVDRLQVDLAEVCDDLCAYTRSTRTTASAPVRARRQRGGSSASHRSPRRT